MKKFLIFSFIFAFIIVFYAGSRPQYSILQSFGTKCSGCHENIQGGGVRNGGGWMARKDLSLIPTSSIGLSGLFDNLSTNSWANDMITFGFDARYQWAKWPAPNTVDTSSSNQYPYGFTQKGNTAYDNMFMQLTPYLVIRPTSWLTLEGQYNLAYEIEDTKRYPGQEPYAFSAYIKPGEGLPTLRAGFFQPTMAMKWDDHTLLGHTFYRTAPTIPDDYAEWGAQLDYEAMSWLSVSGGAFKSTNMAKLGIINDSMSFVGRLFLSPELGHGLTGYASGNIFINGNYRISNVHFGIGMSDKFCLLIEFTNTQKAKFHSAPVSADEIADNAIYQNTFTSLGELTYQVADNFLPFARFERQISRTGKNSEPLLVNQYVIGAHIYFLPFIELLPEYRVVDREIIPGYFSHFAFQIHVWY